ncbi:hypothetical protein Hanom_Chr14g01296451 [Helianthus anomalus]
MVSDEIQQLMDDDGDMAEMYLVEKKAYGVIILRWRSIFGRTQINEWDSVYFCFDFSCFFTSNWSKF